MTEDPIFRILESETERSRYRAMLNNFVRFSRLFAGQRVLDFGASWGTSSVALIRAGASEVKGVEPSADRVERGRALVDTLGLSDRITIQHTPDTGALQFKEGAFPFVLANGVIEHIPQPRDRYVRELWRVVAFGGHLMITETPNKWWPREDHTTGLWFNHWLPRDFARLRAVRAGRFRSDRTDWASSGWRGMSYPELVRPIRGQRYTVVHDDDRLRHRLFRALGLPASIVDPYPVWILRKGGPS